MLFLIQWLGGVYCIKKEDKYASDWVWVYCIFVGWIVIILYLIDNFGSSNTSTNIAPSKDGVQPEQTQIKQNQDTSNSVLNESDTIMDYSSYIEILKQAYSQYGEEMFLPSKIQDFINSNRLDLILNLQIDDIVNDLLKIRKAENTTAKQDIRLSEQAQDEQNQTANNAMPEINNSDSNYFYSYVTRMTDTQLINTINGQYKAIKGTWNIDPCMGEFGSIEFAAVLLLWRYAIANFDRNRESYASLQITLGDIIGCSFFGMPAGEWSDKVDPILNAHADILTYEEFGDVYNHLKDNYSDKIHRMEFNNGNTKADTYKQLYAKFIQIYNSANDYSDMMDFYTEKGLKIKDSMSFSNSNQNAKESLLLQKWESELAEFIDDADISGMPVTLSDNLSDKFYISSYRCPTCGRHMYKTVFPMGKEFPIHIGKGELLSMKRIFTCDRCQVFYTPLPEHKLSHGQCYKLKLAKTKEYHSLLEIYDAHGTTVGRPDA